MPVANLTAREVALSWSGGKDSALALQALRNAGVNPVALLTTFTEDHDRISMHAVRRELARAQAAAAGIAMVEVDIPADCPNRVYEEHGAGAGFEAVLVCVDPAQLDPSFVGRPFDSALLADLPAGVDPCGENGEFHTFVHAGPIFDQPIEIELGETLIRDGFAFQDVVPANSSLWREHSKVA